MSAFSSLIGSLSAEVSWPAAVTAILVSLPVVWFWGRVSFSGMRTDPYDVFYFEWPYFLVPPLWIIRFIVFALGSLAVIYGAYQGCTWIYFHIG